MKTSGSATQEASLLHTAGAIPIALVTWAIVSVLATAIWYLLNVFFTVIRPEIIGFLANIVGGIVGVVAAQALTNKWLPRYHRKAVAVAFFVWCAFLLYLEWIFLPNPTHPIMVTGAAVAAGGTAYYGFWLGEELS